MSVTSTSSVMHAMDNHYVTVDGAYFVQMHLHLYHAPTFISKHSEQRII